MADTSRREMLRRAVDLASLGEVSMALKIPPELVQAWMSGHASMPDRKLLLLADFLEKQAGRL